MKKQHLIVAETFYSIQGEGPTAGVPAIFLRLGGCNLLCGRNPDDTSADGATWECDTIDVWRKGKRIEVNALFEQMQKEHQLILRLKRGAHLVITGGEPLLQQDAIQSFLEIVWDRMGCDQPPYVEIETNGTVTPNVHLSIFVDQWNVSPKLSNSGQQRVHRIVEPALHCFAELSSGKPVIAWGGVSSYPDVWFKFVVSSLDDWEEIVTDYLIGFNIPNRRTVLMPAASNLEQLRETLPMVASLCKAYDVRLSSRAQIEIWNQITGV